MTLICGVKIYVNMCDLIVSICYFLWTSFLVQAFDFLTFGIFQHFDTYIYLHHLSSSQGYVSPCRNAETNVSKKEFTLK